MKKYTKKEIKSGEVRGCDECIDIEGCLDCEDISFVMVKDIPFLKSDWLDHSSEICCGIFSVVKENISDLFCNECGKSLKIYLGELQGNKYDKKITLEITKDGNQYCILLGENLQEGIAGFGDTIFDAMKDFMDRWGNDMESLYRMQQCENLLMDLFKDGIKDKKEYKKINYFESSKKVKQTFKETKGIFKKAMG